MDSAWHVRVVIQETPQQRTCLVEETPEYTTTRRFLDVELIEIVYSDVGTLPLSPGDVVALDFGRDTIIECNGPPDSQPNICFNSCGPVVSDVFDPYFFEQSKEYVLFLNQLPRPQSHEEQVAQALSAFGASAPMPVTTGSDVDESCGEGVQFYVASAENCDNNLVAPTQQQLQELKDACGVATGPDATQGEDEMPEGGSQTPDGGSDTPDGGSDTSEGTGSAGEGSTSTASEGSTTPSVVQESPVSAGSQTALLWLQPLFIMMALFGVMR